MSMDLERKKSKRLTVDERVELLERLKAGESCTALADAYGITKSGVTWIKRNIENCFQQKRSIDAAGGSTSAKRRCTGVEDSPLEKSLYRWFLQKRTICQPVTSAQLRTKALLFNEHLNGPSNFKASDGFLQGFRRRHGIDAPTVQGEGLSPSYRNAADSCKDLADFLTGNEYSLDRIYCADETSLYWKRLPSKDFHKISATNPPGGAHQERVTLMLCANVSGTHKLPPMVIGKSRKEKCLKNVKVLPVSYKRQRDAWMTRELLVEWYVEVFLPEVERVHAGGEKCILLLDCAPCHPPELQLNTLSKRCVAKFLQPMSSFWLQPMGPGVGEKLKKVYKKNLLSLLLTEESPERVSRLLDSLNMLQCCNFVGAAWSSVTEINVRNAWKNVFPVDYDLEFIDFDLQTDAFFDLASRIPGLEGVSAKDTDLWLKSDCEAGWRMLTDQEIIRDTQLNYEEERAEVDEEVEDEGRELNAELSAKEALRCIETFSLWYQTQWECTPEAVLLLESLRVLSVEQIVAQKRFPMDAEPSNK